MTTKSPSLLLDNAAQPANGVTTASPIYWPGGDLSVMFAGTFAGASVQLVCTINMPPNGQVPATPTNWMQDTDWINLGDPQTGPGRQEYGHVNPCMLAVKTSSSASGTRVKALIA